VYSDDLVTSALRDPNATLAIPLPSPSRLTSASSRRVASEPVVCDKCYQRGIVM
jgi:hypothetical protein